MRIDQAQDVPDALGRDRFSAHLLQLIETIPAQHGAVIGLEGVWGAGKTWVLHDVQHLACRPDSVESPVIVWFNPWMLSGATDLVESFLVQLAGELGHPAEQNRLTNAAAIGEKLIGYARALGATKYLAPFSELVKPGSGLVLAATGEALEKAADGAKRMLGGLLRRCQRRPKSKSLFAARDDVSKLLAKFPRRIVVFVDDLDRLPPAELAAMIRVVKVVADFPNVVYVLAYDPDAAGHALESALGLKEDAGRRYLEKIVQLPLAVPELAAHRIQNFATSELRTVMASHAATDADRDDLEKALPLGAALMQTPRDVVRLCTKLAVVAPLAGKDLSPADLLLVEALVLKADGVVRYVDEHRAAMLVIGGSARYDKHFQDRGHLGPRESVWGLVEDEAWKGRLAKERDGWRAPISEDNPLAHPVEQAMRFLFDVAKPDNFQTYPSASRLRLQNLRNWNRWRSLISDSEFFDNGEILDWLAEPPDLDDARVLASGESFNEFCALAADLLDEAPAIAAERFCSFVAGAAEKFGELEFPALHMGLGPAPLVEAVLRKEPDRQVRHRALKSLCRPGLVWFSGDLLSRVYRDAFGTQQAPARAPTERLIENEDDASALCQQWTAMALRVLNAWTEPKPPREVYGLAWQITHLKGDLAALRDAVARIVEELPRGLESVFADRWRDGNFHSSDYPSGDFLPAPADLVAALQRSPDFETVCSKLVAHWRQSLAGVEQSGRDAAAPAE